MIIKTEDCQLLSDRWGDPFIGAQFPESLLAFMWNEETFVVIRGGVLGILHEYELATPDDDDTDNDAVETSWGQRMTYAQVCNATLAIVAQMVRMFPDAQVYACQHEGIYARRIAIRSFIPHDKLSLDMIEKISTAAQDVKFTLDESGTDLTAGIAGLSPKPFGASDPIKRSNW